MLTLMAILMLGEQLIQNRRISLTLQALSNITRVRRLENQLALCLP